jgi:hypothetical protein
LAHFLFFLCIKILPNIIVEKIFGRKGREDKWKKVNGKNGEFSERCYEMK